MCTSTTARDNPTVFAPFLIIAFFFNMAPVNEPTYRRIVALDVARGIAILGTLATNIWIFATWHQMDNVMEQYFDPNFTLWDEVRAASTNGTAAEAADALFNAASALVTDGKFLGLLTIMFGIGMEIQRQSAVKRNQRWPGLYYCCLLYTSPSPRDS